MSQVDLLNRLLPSIPEVTEILSKIREKHNIPEVLPEHEQLIETLSQERTLEEWEVIRQEIENGLRAWFLSSPALSKLVGLFNDAQGKTGEIKSFLADERLNVPEDVADRFIEGLVKNAVSGLEALNIFFKIGSEKLLDYLITGRPIEVPALWFNLVGTVPISPDGEKYVVAVRPQRPLDRYSEKIMEAF